MKPSITITNLTKRYGQAPPALQGLTLQVQPGEIYGFLGANGAGKSTTIRLLLNFLQPTSGTAQIMGLDSIQDAVEIKKHVGYLAGEVALYNKATGSELLDYLKSFQPVGNYRWELEARFKPNLSQPLSELSKGNRQKVAIIQACMHEPSVLILDEPTSGLDPLMQEAFYQTLTEAKERGAAILMSSHNLTEAQRICDRIGIVRQGKLVHEQTLDKHASVATTLFEVSFANADQLRHCSADAQLTLVSKTSAHTAMFRPAHSIAKALSAFGKYDIVQFSSRVPDLEDEFLEFYGDAA